MGVKHKLHAVLDEHFLLQTSDYVQQFLALVMCKMCP